MQYVTPTRPRGVNPMANLNRDQFCHQCRKSIIIEAGNAAVMEFPQVPGFWFIRAVCTYCRARNVLMPLTRIADAVAAGCPWIKQDGLPPLDLVIWCEQELGIHFVLSNHDENEVAFLAWLLDHSAEELSDDYPKAA